jgi:ECF sigma factor
MRRILVDHARARHAEKRDGLAAKLTFDEALVVTDEPQQDLLGSTTRWKRSRNSTSGKAESSRCGSSAA